MIFRPHAYQQHCIEQIIRIPKLGLFLDMGLGKTVTTLTAVHELKSFRALFWGLDETCEFVKIMGYRGMKIPAKMPKEQKAFYRKMKRIHALPTPKDEKEKQDAITEALMDGGDLSGLL